MNELALSAIELFSGVGMLGEGVRAGFAHLGVGYRTCVHVEREAHAAAVLVARMEEGSLDAAPIWSDVTTFDARAWRGKVDCVVAGFPCQDLSVAGRRAGLDGKRSGLFFEVLRIAEDSDARFIVLENVAGISSATATVMDEEEGELDERAAARVVGELADLGWNAEWINVSADDVGANHGRARWFCLAWRSMVDTGRMQRCAGYEQDRSRVAEACRHQTNDRTSNGSFHVADACGNGRDGLDREGGSWRGVREAGNAMEHSEGIGDGSRRLPSGDESTLSIVVGGSASLGHSKSDRRDQGRTEPSGQQGRSDVTEHGRAMADPSSTGRQGNELGRACDGNRGGQEAYGSVSEFCGLFAPGPSDPRWGSILERFPEVAPALEPTFRSVVNGLAFDMGDSRAACLKCVGNGVVALSAAVAVVVLARRAGLFA